MSKIKMSKTIKSCALTLGGITCLITGVLGSPIHEVMALTINNVDELSNTNPLTKTRLCLDSFGKIGDARMNTCHGRRGNQEWQYNYESGELRNPSTRLCLDSFGKTGNARMNTCHGRKGNQEWRYNHQSGELRNPSTRLCLDSFGKIGNARVNTCHGRRGNQEWRS